MNLKFVEYVWLDGHIPTQQLRSKSRIISCEHNVILDNIPEWSFDGSSTNQAVGHDSDCLLKPVCLVKNPLRKDKSDVVLCEVMNPDGTPHSTKKRAVLREKMEHVGCAHDPYLGFEQEYTFFKGRDPLGWPNNGYPEPLNSENKSNPYSVSASIFKLIKFLFKYWDTLKLENVFASSKSHANHQSV